MVYFPKMLNLHNALTCYVVYMAVCQELTLELFSASFEARFDPFSFKLYSATCLNSAGDLLHAKSTEQ